MARRIRGTLLDWHDSGVDIKVELATSGDLVLGQQTKSFPLETGGPQGVPVGFNPFVLNDLAATTQYNHTTSSGIYTVNNKAPTTPWSAGAYGPTQPVIVGAKYSLQCQVRLQSGRSANSTRYPQLETRRKTDGAWLYYLAPASAVVQTSWEQINVTASFGVDDRYDAIRVKLSGGSLSNQQVLWGVQYQGVSIGQIDAILPEPTWRDITCDVRSINIRHGREKFTNRYEVGHFDIELINNDGEYRYMDPHPFGLRPGRQVRVTASHKGVTYPIAYGILDEIGQSYAMDGTTLATFAVSDATSVMSNTKVVSGVYSAPDSAQRIAELVRQSGYTKVSIDAPGGRGMQQISASGRTQRDEAGVTGDSEGGSFYGERDGTITYKGRQWRSTDPHLTTVQADFVAQSHDGYGPMPNPDGVPTVDNSPLICVNEIATDWSMDRVINYVTLANAGGTAHTYTNDASIKKHGIQTYQRLDFVNYFGGGQPTDDAMLPERAADFMDGFSDPILRVNSIAFNPGVQKNQDQAWEFVLSVFLNWAIRVWYSQPTVGWGFIVVTHVQSVEHTITPDGWGCRFSVDQPLAYTEVEWADPWTGWDQGNWDEDVWDGASIEGGSFWSDGDLWSDNEVWS